MDSPRQISPLVEQHITGLGVCVYPRAEEFQAFLCFESMRSTCFSQSCARQRSHNVLLSLQRICTGLVRSFFGCMTGGRKSAKASAISLCSDPQTPIHAPMGHSFSISLFSFPSRFITRHLLDPEGEDYAKLVLRYYSCLHFRSLQ